jgi:hypothetical protein
MQPKPADKVYEHVEKIKTFKNEWDDMKKRFKEMPGELYIDETFLYKYMKQTLG